MACRSQGARKQSRKAEAERQGREFKDEEHRALEREKKAAAASARAETLRIEAADRRVRSLLREKVKNQIKKQKRKGHLDWRIRDCLVHDRWSPTILKTLGYTVSELKLHIERQFTKGMDWDAFAVGLIHLDHIVPVRSFDLSKDEEVRACWAMTNLRPLWAKENIVKGGERLHLI